MEERNIGGAGLDILFACRNELFMNMPYFDEALCALRYAEGSDKTVSIATDGAALYYSDAYLCERYIRSGNYANRAYLHLIMHCLFRHLWKRKGRDAAL